MAQVCIKKVEASEKEFPARLSANSQQQLLFRVRRTAGLSALWRGPSQFSVVSGETIFYGTPSFPTDRIIMAYLPPAPWIKTILPDLDLARGASVGGDIDSMALWCRWSARSLMPLGCDIAELTGGNPHLYQRVIDCHNGPANEADWVGCLQPMFTDLFERGYPIRRSFETAYASAMAYADQNSAMITEYFGTPEAYADYYATLNSSTNQKAASQANAVVRAKWTAKSYARNDSVLFAQTYPQAIIYALTEGYANAHTSFDASKARQDARKRIYDDLLATLSIE